MADVASSSKKRSEDACGASCFAFTSFFKPASKATPWSYEYLKDVLKTDPENAEINEKHMRLYNDKFRTVDNMRLAPIEQVSQGATNTATSSTDAGACDHVHVNICTFNMFAQGHLESSYKKKKETMPEQMLWEPRKKRMLTTIQASPNMNITPDIFAMQEVESATFSSLFTGAFWPNYQGVFLSKFLPERKREGQAVFVNQDKWRIIVEKAGYFAHPDFSEALGEEPKDGAWPQKMLVVGLQHVLLEKVKIVIAVGHLGLEPKGAMVGDMIRTMSLQELQKGASEVAAELGGVPYFICLDQNADRGEVPFQYARAAGLHSAKEPGPTHNLGQEGHAEILEHDFIYYEDRVLRAAGRENIIAESGDLQATIPTAADGVSDHVPVFASLKIPCSVWL